MLLVATNMHDCWLVVYAAMRESAAGGEAMERGSEQSKALTALWAYDPKEENSIANHRMVL
jgi:hypothetical protein